MNKKRLFFICICLVLSKGCETSTSPDALENRNLITNSTFEVDGRPSIEGWYFWSNVPSTIEYSDDIPTNGAGTTVVLSVGDRIGKYLQTTIPALEGENSYILSVWGKSTSIDPLDTPGSIQLIINDSVSKKVSVQDTAWKLYELPDTIFAVASDSITIKLDGGISYGILQTYFNYCKFEVMK